MPITYRDDICFTPAQLEKLFSSVGWLSARYPQRLYRALQSCGAVFTAWDGDALVGLINALDDGGMTCYVHWLLVDPALQGKGIGRALVQRVKQRYADTLSIVLISERAETVDFYKSCGFEPHEESVAMYLTDEGQKDI